MVQILIDHGIFHLFSELLILQAAEFDEWADVVPVFFIILAVCFEHPGQLVRNLFGDIIRYFIDKSVVLESTPGYVERQVRAVDDSL